MTERASMWELSKRVVRLRLVRLALWAARRLMDYVEKVKREAAPLDGEGG